MIFNELLLVLLFYFVMASIPFDKVIISCLLCSTKPVWFGQFELKCHSRVAKINCVKLLQCRGPAAAAAKIAKRAFKRSKYALSNWGLLDVTMELTLCGYLNN